MSQANKTAEETKKAKKDATDAEFAFQDALAKAFIADAEYRADPTDKKKQDQPHL